MGARKKAARKTTRRPRKSARTNGASARGASRRRTDESDNESDNENEESGDDEQQERKPRKPRQEIERASMFAVVESAESDDGDTVDKIVDVFADEGSAEIVCQAHAEASGNESFVDPVEVLLIKTKIPGTRGRFDVDCHVLDRAAPQPLKPESSESASAALVRKRAIAKLTPEERAALGLGAMASSDEPSKPSKPSKSNGRASAPKGTVENPNTPDGGDEVDDDEVDDDENTAPDPFA